MTRAQQLVLIFADTLGKVSARNSIDLGCGPATPGLLASMGYLENVGTDADDGSQTYRRTDKPLPPDVVAFDRGEG